MRHKNEGETPAERAYFRISNLTRLRDAYTLLSATSHSADPLNIPEEEYREVMRLVDGWIARLENRRKGR